MKEAIKWALLLGLATTLVLPRRITPQVVSATGTATSEVLGKLIPVT